MWCDEGASRSPTWSCYDGVVDDTGKEGQCSSLRSAAKKISVIARGAQGVVYRAYLMSEDGVVDRTQVFAIKRMFRSDGSECYATMNTAVCADREMTFLQQFAANPEMFPHMVQLHRVLMAPSGEPCAVLEHCPFDLSSCVIKTSKRSRSGNQQWPESLPRPVQAWVLREILLGVQELHRRQIVHRDLKLSNVLIRQNGSLCLADFGSARSCEGVTETQRSASPCALRTTLLYRSPESLLGALPVFQLKAQDSWSVGVMFAEILRGKHAFTAHGELSMINQVFGLVGTPTEADWPEFFTSPIWQSFQFQPCASIIEDKFRHSTSAEGLGLLKSLLHPNPERRISIDAALDHAFFSVITDETQDEWTRIVEGAIRYRGEAQSSSSVLQLQQLLRGGADDEDDEDDDCDDRFGQF